MVLLIGVLCCVVRGVCYVCCVVWCGVSGEAELSFLNSLVSFGHQMTTLTLSDTELALLCALVLVNPSQ